MVWLVRLWPSLLDATYAVQPETILRWHRTGFRAFWRWKSRRRAGRPPVDRDLRELIQRMNQENPLWGASRIHGELLMLGFEIAQSTCLEIHEPRGQTALAELEDISAQSCRCDSCCGPLYHSDAVVRPLVCIRGPGPRPAAAATRPDPAAAAELVWLDRQKMSATAKWDASTTKL
jgi:hypothetical protein